MSLGVCIDDAPSGMAFAGDHVIITLSGIEINNVNIGECSRNNGCWVYVDAQICQQCKTFLKNGFLKKNKDSD